MDNPKTNIEAIYPLSYMQQGLLFHALYNPRSAAYFLQYRWTYQGNLNTQALRRAWETAVAQHAVLRTCFFWDKHKEPFQLVRKTVKFPWFEYDWGDVADEEHGRLLEKFMDEDRSRPFKLEEAPLIRFHLITLNDRTYQFIWSHHHLLMDGWSLQLLYKDVLIEYAALVEGKSAVPIQRTPFRNYIGWLKKQDPAHAQIGKGLQDVD